jgi:hypothetical protein
VAGGAEEEVASAEAAVELGDEGGGEEAAVVGGLGALGGVDVPRPRLSPMVA